MKENDHDLAEFNRLVDKVYAPVLKQRGFKKIKDVSSPMGVVEVFFESGEIKVRILKDRGGYTGAMIRSSSSEGEGSAAIIAQFLGLVDPLKVISPEEEAALIDRHFDELVRVISDPALMDRGRTWHLNRL